MSFPKYPAYKDSGVGWIGEVPIGWNIVPLKRIFSLKNGATPKSDQSDLWDGEITWITPADLNSEQPEIITHSKRTISAKGAESCAVSIVPKGSIIISTRAPIGSIGLSGIDLCTNQGCRSLVPDEGVSSKFFLYFLYSAASELQVLGKGTTFLELSSDSLASFPSCFPSLPEQQAIASFLDRECGKIDTLIAEQERLIALLAEKRQAVISHAVTKGLNPNAPMKDSGIPWIGMVPEGWEVHPLKNVASVQTGIAKGKEVIEQKSVQMPYLRVANVQDGYLDLSEVSRINIDRDQVERYLLRQGDVLMNEGGDFDKLGRGAIWHGEISPCIHQNHVFAVRPKSIMSEWVSAVIGSDYAKFYFMTRSKQSTNLASISSTNLMMLPIIVPSIDDQKTIVNFLGSKKSQFENLMNSANSIITLLKERRAALISAAVTGKIDVRAQSKAIAA